MPLYGTKAILEPQVGIFQVGTKDMEVAGVLDG